MAAFVRSASPTSAFRKKRITELEIQLSSAEHKLTASEKQVALLTNTVRSLRGFKNVSGSTINSLITPAQSRRASRQDVTSAPAVLGGATKETPFTTPTRRILPVKAGRRFSAPEVNPVQSERKQTKSPSFSLMPAEVGESSPAPLGNISSQKEFPWVDGSHGASSAEYSPEKESPAQVRGLRLSLSAQSEYIDTLESEARRTKAERALELQEIHHLRHALEESETHRIAQKIEIDRLARLLDEALARVERERVKEKERTAESSESEELRRRVQELEGALAASEERGKKDRDEIAQQREAAKAQEELFRRLNEELVTTRDEAEELRRTVKSLSSAEVEGLATRRLSAEVPIFPWPLQSEAEGVKARLSELSLEEGQPGDRRSKRTSMVGQLIDYYDSHLTVLPDPHLGSNGSATV